MEKKILIFISILILSHSSFASSSPELPLLPPSTDLVSPTSEEKKSIWNKFLDFFSFGPKNNEINPATAPDDNLKSVKADEKQIDVIDKEAETNTNSTIEIPELATSSQEEKNIPVNNYVPTEVGISSLTDKTNTALNNPEEELKLPEGFSEEIENNKSETTANKNMQVELVKNLPLQPKLTVTDSEPKSDDVSENIINLVPVSEIPANLSTEAPNQIPVDKISNNKDLKEANIDKAIGIIDKNSEVYKYRKQLQDRLNKPQDLPQITISETSKNSTSGGEVENDAKQLKFISDEAQVLMLANDDVVLGEITNEALSEFMDFSTYTILFWHNYNIIKNEPARKQIETFIKTYDNKLNTHTKQEIKEASKDAFNAIDRNSIYELINLLENYPILQILDSQGNTLLHHAVLNGNYSAAKFLIIKGINLSILNNEDDSAIDIAISKNDQSIITLLKDAGLKSY